MKRKEDKHTESHKKIDKNDLISDNQENIELEQEEMALEDAEGASVLVAEADIQIAELKANLAAANDKYLRLSAEFDNFRKRTLKEKMDLMKTASESVMTNILSVIDDFDRAIQVIGESTDISATKEGISLIYNKFKEFTFRNGVKEIDALGKDFDTDLHEAITKIPAPSEDLKGKNVDVIQKGYTLNDKVIRFAKVVVGE